jgi:hypothetical protein
VQAPRVPFGSILPSSSITSATTKIPTCLACSVVLFANQLWRSALPRAHIGFSTEDGADFTEGASQFEKPVFEKGAQSSAIENTVTSMLQCCGAARIYIFSGAVASGSSLVLPWAAADTRGHYSIARYTMQEQWGGARERRRGGGTSEGGRRSLGLLVARQYKLELGCDRGMWQKEAASCVRWWRVACYGLQVWWKDLVLWHGGCDTADTNTELGGGSRKHNSKDSPLSRGTARSEKGPLRSVKEQDNRVLPPHQCEPLRTSADPARWRARA